MLEIRLNQVGRRFNRDWIFRNLDFTFTQGTRYAILGPNGSGKSTLLRVVAGHLTPSEGALTYRAGARTVTPENLHRELAIAAPYLELIEEFTLEEQIEFHFKFKSFLRGWNTKSLIEYIGLGSSRDKPLRFFSSGMRQRVKLALACFSDTKVILLDEPTVNLDSNAIQWYHQLLGDTVGERMILICSNQEDEYRTCTEHLHIADYVGSLP